MVFKKHNWIRFGQGGDMIEVTVRDQTGAKIDFFRCNDKNDYKRVAEILRDKYGFAPARNVEDSPNFNEEKNWLNKDMNW